MQKVQIPNTSYFIDKNGVITNSNGLVLRYTDDKKNKRLLVTLDKRQYRVVKLMASIFLHKYKQDQHRIVFKDGDYKNCQLSNLDLGLRFTGINKMTREKALAIKVLKRSGFPYSELMKLFDVSKSLIYEIAKDPRL